MIDLYQVIVPFIAIITLLSFIALKLSLKDNVALLHLQLKQPSTSINLAQSKQQTSFKSIVKHLLLHFTLVQTVAVRRATPKLSLLLSISATSLAVFLSPSPFAYLFMGTLIYFVYFLSSMLLTRPPKQQSSSTKQEAVNFNLSRQKYLQVIYSGSSILLNLVLMGLMFKNYKNSMLANFVANLAINLSLDNFVARPILTFIAALPLSRSQTVVSFIQQSQANQLLLLTSQKLGLLEMIQKPGKMFSPSKLAKRIPLQIEPVPFDQSMLKKRQQLGLQKPIDLLKRIKKQRILPPLNTTPLKTQLQVQNSLNSLFNSTKKDPQSPIHHIERQQPEHIEENVQQIKDQFQLKNKKAGSQNLIMINPSRQEVENEEDLTEQDVNNHNKRITEEEQSAEGMISLSKRGTIVQSEDNNHDPLKISLNQSGAPSSRHEPLRICLNNIENIRSEESQDPDCQNDNYRRRRQTIAIDQNCIKNNFGLLQIKQKDSGSHHQEIQEIDLNSPERRRRLHVNIEQDDQSKVSVVKRKKKKFSCDERNRVIKFSTGQPYLQYLPNMLNKDAKSKKSQAITKKEIVVDSRIVNSVKRPNKKKLQLQNNQNLVPEFIIEEL